jgi:hypothetical protein
MFGRILFYCYSKNTLYQEDKSGEIGTQAESVAIGYFQRKQPIFIFQKVHQNLPAFTCVGHT